MRFGFLTAGFPLVLSNYQAADDLNLCGTESIPAYTAANTTAKLVSVNTFFRHGMRGTTKRVTCFPGNAQISFPAMLASESAVQYNTTVNGTLLQSNRLVKEYTAGFQYGQLVDYAVTQMDRLASYLMTAYPGIINSANLDNLYLRSTDLPRTLGSLTLLIQGIAGGSGSVFPVVTDEYDYDPLAMSTKLCPLVNQIETNYTTSASYKEITDSDAYKQCGSLWKSNVGTTFDSQARDCILPPACAGRPFPSGVNMTDDLFSCVMENFISLHKLHYGFPSNNTWTSNAQKYCTLATGPFMKTLYTNVVEESQSGLWAAHDDTIACMLTNWGLWDGYLPVFADFISIETYDDGRVRILRDGVELGWKDNMTEIVSEVQRNSTLFSSACAVPNNIPKDVFVFKGVIAVSVALLAALL